LCGGLRSARTLIPVAFSRSTCVAAACQMVDYKTGSHHSAVSTTGYPTWRSAGRRCACRPACGGSCGFTLSVMCMLALIRWKSLEHCRFVGVSTCSWVSRPLRVPPPNSGPEFAPRQANRKRNLCISQCNDHHRRCDTELSSKLLAGSLLRFAADAATPILLCMGLTSRKRAFPTP
jgi:hypothetical protein